jgi:hypothetical protein
VSWGREWGRMRKRKGKSERSTTDLSILMAQRLRMLAVQSKTSKEIQISQRIQPRIHEPDIASAVCMFPTRERERRKETEEKVSICVSERSKQVAAEAAGWLFGEVKAVYKPIR